MKFTQLKHHEKLATYRGIKAARQMWEGLALAMKQKYLLMLALTLLIRSSYCHLFLASMHHMEAKN